MGFEKQGMSILITFWGIVAISALTGMTFILCLLPIIWFYSFFHTHNLKNLTEEEFMLEKDRYLINLGYVMENKEELLPCSNCRSVDFNWCSSDWKVFGKSSLECYTDVSV